MGIERRGKMVHPYRVYHPFLLCLARTGLRLGEAIALKWGDIDWRGGFIHVQRSYSRGELSTPKSGKDRRVDMSEQLVRVLRATYGERFERAVATGAPPLTPPWFLPGAETVWQRIAETERALRRIVREVYATRFGDAAARRIEERLPEPERESLARALRARPAGSEPLSIVDYLYLGELPSLLFATDVWQEARGRLGGAPNAEQRLQAAVGQIAPVRNEIAHVREVERDRLIRASVECGAVLEMLQGSSSQRRPFRRTSRLRLRRDTRQVLNPHLQREARPPCSCLAGA